jgi:organic hydroperoxide reductase OsmC/OhrA
MVAGAMGLELGILEVEVEGEVDVRGSLGMPEAPVGFRRMRVFTRVELQNGGPSEVRRLLGTAQALCVVGQTLRNGVALEHVAQ